MPADVQVVIAVTTLLALLLVAFLAGVDSYSRRRHRRAVEKQRAAIRARAARVIR